MEVPLTTKIAGAAEAVVKRRVQVCSSPSWSLRGGAGGVLGAVQVLKRPTRVRVRHTRLRVCGGRGTDVGMRPGRRAAKAGRRAASTPSIAARAQAKIEHYLPTATDSVLCDYVLVMVGNKKTSRQVAQDLEVRHFSPMDHPARYLHQGPLPRVGHARHSLHAFSAVPRTSFSAAHLVRCGELNSG